MNENNNQDFNEDPKGREYKKEEERQEQENFEKYFGDVFNVAAAELGHEKEYLKGDRKTNFFNSEEAKNMARILSNYGKTGYKAYYEFMMDQVYWLDEEASRKALRRMEEIRNHLETMEGEFLNAKSQWLEIDSSLVVLRDDVRQGKTNVNEAKVAVEGLQKKQDGIKSGLLEMSSEVQKLEKEYEHFGKIIQESVKEAIKTSREVKALRDQGSKFHGHTLKHYAEMHGIKENTRQIYKKMISKGVFYFSMGLICGLMILFGGVSWFQGQGKNLKYHFVPDHIAIKKPQFAHFVKNEKDAQYLLGLAKKKGFKIRDNYLLKPGSYVEINSKGFLVRTKDSLSKIEKLKDSKQGSIAGIKITYTHLISVPDRLADKIESEEEVERIKNSYSKFFGWQGLVKVGNYVINDSNTDPTRKNKYHILASPEKFDFTPLSILLETQKA